MTIIDAVTNGNAQTPDSSQLTSALAPTLEMLQVLAEEQHVTRTAERLRIPQPSLSRTLSSLGDLLGTPVVARSGRGIRLTRAGTMLAEAAGHGLRGLEAGCRRVVEELDPESGHVVFAFLYTQGSSWVPALLRDFRAEHPGVRFSLHQAPNTDLLAWLRAGEVNLCLTSPAPENDPELNSATVRREPLRMVLPQGHRLAGRKRLRLAELHDEDFVALRPGYGLRHLFDELCWAAGLSPRLAFEGEEASTVRGLVAAGLGVALLPPAEHGADAGTVELPLDPVAHRTIGLVWPAEELLPPAARTFRDFTLDRAERRP